MDTLIFSRGWKSVVGQLPGFSLQWLSAVFQDSGALHLYQLFRLPSQLQPHSPTPGLGEMEAGTPHPFLLCHCSQSKSVDRGCGREATGLEVGLSAPVMSLQQASFPRQRPFILVTRLGEFAVFPADTAL